jgi:serine/threonine protein kinase/Tol biopolymer transport system component
MSPARWRQIEDLYHAAKERDPAERARFLTEFANGDEELRREVESLLAQDDAELMGLGNRGPLPAGTQVGPYKLEAILGEGGMGVVYRALDSKLNRPVAVKFLSREIADVAARRRFQRESRLASSLNHPHILTVHDAGEFEGQQYLVTEFIDGGTLKDWSRAERRSWREIVELLGGVADGLAAAHAAGILHRDIKPANILVGKNGYAKLADFGLAKLSPRAQEDVTQTEHTRPGVLLGTIPYMSPEQASGRAVDARSDCFSFGVVLYELIAGQRPFTGANDLEVLRGIVHGAPQPLSRETPAALQAVVEKALEKDPNDRYQSMREMVTDLRRLTRSTVETIPESVSSPRRAKLILAAATLSLAAFAAAGAVVFSKFRAPARPAGREYIQITHYADSARSPALSHDGRMLAFIRGESSDTMIGPGQIYVKLLPDGEAVRLTNDNLLKMTPRFSPDGQIAYGTLDTKGWATWIVPVLGRKEPRLFLTNAEGLNWFKTEGNQHRILFSEAGKGITMSVVASTESRSQRRTVFEQDGIMDHLSYLSPDGTQLLLAEMDFNGWQPCRLAPFDGSSKGKKVGPQPAQCNGAAWSPDGQWMYFSADTGKGFHIWRARYPDGKPEQFTSGVSEEEGIEFDPDGKSFLTAIGTRQTTLWIHDSRADRRVAAESNTFLPTFSADGNRLYYLAGSMQGVHTIYRGGLWTMDLASGERHRLLQDYDMEHYAVSRDEQRVLFVATGDPAVKGVWIARLDGSAPPVRLSSSEGLHAFFGSGRDVFFAAQEKDGTFIYAVQDDGTGLKRAIPSPVYFLYGVSPDGKQLAVWEPEPGAENLNWVSVYPLDGGSPVPICKGCGGRTGEFPPLLSWSADGKFAYFSFWSMASYMVPLRPGQILPPLPASGIRSPDDAGALPGARKFEVAGAFPSPNPSVYAYSKASAQRNIYRVPVD